MAGKKEEIKRAALKFMEVGKWDAAVTYIDLALREDPKDLGLYDLKLLCLNNSKRFEEILSVCDAALQLQPNGETFLYFKSLAYSGLGKHPEALELAIKNADLHPTSKNAWISLAKMYKLTNPGKDLPPKVELLFAKACEKAHAIDPHDADLLTALGQSYGHLSDYELAMQCYQKVAAIDPNYKDVQEFINIYKDAIAKGASIPLYPSAKGKSVSPSSTSSLERQLLPKVTPSPTKSETPVSGPPMVAEISQTERRYQNVPAEKIVSSARWGLESNGLEITDLLNPEPKTTKLMGVKNKWGTVEVYIIDQKPDIIVRIKPIISKKDAETAFLVVFWEKFAAEVGLQKKDVQAEMDALRKGDFRTFRIADKAAMDLLAEQGRWGLESMGLKILESLRPDAFTAAITGTGKLGKTKTDVHVYIKGGNNLAVVQLQTDKDVTGETRRFWEQLKLNFGESLEEENLKTSAITQRSAEDQAALDTLTGIWNQITQKDKDLGSMVTFIEADPARTETEVSPLVPHAKDFIPWPIVPVLQRVLQPGRGRNASYLVDLSYIRVEEVMAHPAIFTFARLGPNPITKDLQITDKLTFSYQGMDFTDELGRSLREIEEPVLVKPLKSAYSDATMTHYKAEIQGKEKGGSKYSKFLDYLLAEPIRIFNILVGDSEQMVVIARAFLSPDGKIAPLPSTFLRLMDQLVTNLDRYCTKPRPTNIAADEAQPTINVALNRCPFCNWLLTPGKTVCPMCRKELPTREADFIPPPPPPRPPEGDLLQPKIVEPPSLITSEQSKASGTCPNCNYSNPPGSTFCMHCGMKFEEMTTAIPFSTGTQPQLSGVEGIDQRIQEINYQITALQGVLNDLQAAFTNGSIKFEQYQASNDQYVQQIGKLQEEKRALERKKFESFKL